MDKSKPILFIEDDEVDGITIIRIFHTLGITNKLIHKVNGEDALNYLTCENNEKPGVILLDLNMPPINGREFLQIVRNDPNLNSISVIIVTTSENDRDLIGANVIGYIVKPLGFNDFVAEIKNEFEKFDSHSLIR